MSKKEFVTYNSLDKLYETTEYLEPRKMETYDDGIYKYVYGGCFSFSGLVNVVEGQRGWGVQLKDLRSIYPVMKRPLSSIHGWPVVNLNCMFYRANARLIDLSGAPNESVIEEIFPTNFGNIAYTMKSAFEESKATTIVLSEGFGRNAINMNCMFENSSVKELLIPAGFGQVATDMEFMFYGSKMTKMTFHEGFGKKSKHMEHMFASSQLKELILPKDFGREAKDMGCMFYESQLKSLAFPEGFGAIADDMRHMFAMSTKMKTVTFPEGFGENCQHMLFMFSFAKIPKIVFPEKFGLNAVDTGRMFEDAVIEELYLPEGFAHNCKNISIFANTKVKTVYLTSEEELSRWSENSNSPQKPDTLVFAINP